MAEKKYSGEKNASFMLQSKIMEGKGPSISGTTVSVYPRVLRVTSQLNDTALSKFICGGGRGVGGMRFLIARKPCG